MEDLCKPHPIAHGLNSEPTPAPDVQVRAGNVILHLSGLGRETNLLMDVVPQEFKGEPGSDDRYNWAVLRVPKDRQSVVLG